MFWLESSWYHRHGRGIWYNTSKGSSINLCPSGKTQSIFIILSDSNRIKYMASKEIYKITRVRFLLALLLPIIRCMKANHLFSCDDGHGIAKGNQNLDKKIWWIASVFFLLLLMVVRISLFGPLLILWFLKLTII